MYRFSVLQGFDRVGVQAFSGFPASVAILPVAHGVLFVLVEQLIRRVVSRYFLSLLVFSLLLTFEAFVDIYIRCALIGHLCEGGLKHFNKISCTLRTFRATYMRISAVERLTDVKRQLLVVPRPHVLQPIRAQVKMFARDKHRQVDAHIILSLAQHLPVAP